MRQRVRRVAVPAVLLMLAACAGHSPPQPVPAGNAVGVERTGRTQVGLASFYGKAFHGQRTASGVPFNMRALVAAHPTLPFGTRVRVTNLANQRNVVVRIVDRGPTRPNRAEGVIIDLSRGAAEQLQFVRQGRTRVRVEVLK
jgi:rare lipoprotein A